MSLMSYTYADGYWIAVLAIVVGGLFWLALRDDVREAAKPLSPPTEDETHVRRLP